MMNVSKLAFGVVVSALAAMTFSTSAVADETPQMSSNGNDLCVEKDVGFMWMNTAWESRGDFRVFDSKFTAWTRNNSVDTMITYVAYVHTDRGQIVKMLCQVANR